MTPLIRTAFDVAIESALTLNNQASALLGSGLFEQLVSKSLIREIECTERGMLLHPMQEPRAIVDFFHEALKLTFSREKNANDTYDWITVWPGDRGFNLYIVAAEVFDMTGTVVSPTVD
jgi:hypothetical protein